MVTYRIILLTALILIIGACSRILRSSVEPREIDAPDVTNISPVLRTELINREGSQWDVELDFVVLRALGAGGEKNFERAINQLYDNYSFLPDRSIIFRENGIDTVFFNFNSMEYVESEPNPSDVSIGLLIDQSEVPASLSFGGTFETLGGVNGITAFIDQIEAPNEFLIGTYPGTENDPIDLLTDQFGQFSLEVASEVALLPAAIGGTTPLLDAMDAMLDIIDSRANNLQRHLVVVAKTPDNSSIRGLTVDDIIEKANNLNISVSVVWRLVADNGFDYNVATELPTKTNGFSLISVPINAAMISLVDLLQKREPFYRLSFSIFGDRLAESEFAYQGFMNVVHQNQGVEIGIDLGEILIFHVE